MPYLENILCRRSTGKLREPAPTTLQIRSILSAAYTVPDHGCLAPVRLILVEGKNRDVFAEALVASGKEQDPGLSPEKIKKLEAKAYLAPCLVILVFSPQKGKIPIWEQRVSAGCSGYALTLAADAMGFGAIWKTFKQGPGASLRQLLQMEDQEEMLGWINIGSLADESRLLRVQKSLDGKMQRLSDKCLQALP